MNSPHLHQSLKSAHARIRFKNQVLSPVPAHITGLYALSHKLAYKDRPLELDDQTFAGQRDYSDDYQYLQHSKLRTMHFQRSLPRLPIPDLDKTCQRYLLAQQPLLTKEEFKETQKLVTHFQQGIGKDLQKELQAYDAMNKHTSYISAPWFEMYLKDRLPLPINTNPFLQFVSDPKEEYNTVLIRSSNMLVSALRFLKSLRANILEPEVYHMKPKKSDTQLFRTVTGLLPTSVSWYGAYFFKAFPLDMSQFSSLFNSTRIPKKECDVLYKDESARHMLIMRNGNFYVFDAIRPDGNIVSPEEIFSCLSYILKDPTPRAEYPIGLLTTENRDTWADLRAHLESIGNKEALQLIDTALFNLVLDDDVTLGGNDHVNVPTMIRHFMHGDGRNRWFDKSFSLIFSKDGHASINFEHSWGDGVAVLRLFNEVFRDSTEKPRISPDTQSNIDITGLVKKVDFKIDSKIQEGIKNAEKRYQQQYNNMNVNFLVNEEGLGKTFCKEQRISPDALMQMAFQVAYHKLKGKACASYESCSTSAFKHGRTETIRPCTNATKELSEGLNNQKLGHEEIRKLVHSCSAMHGELTKNAAMGQGFDRHLFVFRHLANQKGMSIPSIYHDEAYVKINKNIISTSTLDVPAAQLGGFGPVVSNGLGIGYVIRDQMLGTAVTSYKNHWEGQEFIASLNATFNELYNVLKKTAKKSV